MMTPNGTPRPIPILAEELRPDDFAVGVEVEADDVFEVLSEVEILAIVTELDVAKVRSEIDVLALTDVAKVLGPDDVLIPIEVLVKAPVK